MRSDSAPVTSAGSEPQEAEIAVLEEHDRWGTTVSRVPAKFSLTILKRCNLRCPLCYLLIKDRAHFDEQGRMPFEAYESILLRYRDHIETVTLTGGEPLLHPELEKFVDLTQSLGISVGLPTNGTLVKRNIPILAKLSGHFQISLDAYDAKSYNDSRRGTERQWRDIEAGLRLLKEAGIRFNISFLVSKENIRDVFRMLEFAREAGPVLVNLHSFNPHARDDASILKKGDSEVEAVFAEIMDDRDHPFDISMPVLFDLESDHFETKICRYPWDGAYIGEDGAISYCCHIAPSNGIGNIHDESYDFNPPSLKKWRKALLARKLPADCLYCHRRFLGDESSFDSKTRTWTHQQR